ncbi:hypothetical protein ma871 [Moumouvirus australiensis]|uniref:Uncharacterized protein n=1 Tax=Moumouvirus australiensis TaxID=2109587 RepID=A0A2P1EN12_9VIRU|nr:hypothetical protein QKC55_gp033 [Moumouvirus australiensis]AVL95258.1 hypothetical protein ma871 [Moumouvirus australiensis]
MYFPHCLGFEEYIPISHHNEKKFIVYKKISIPVYYKKINKLVFICTEIKYAILFMKYLIKNKIKDKYEYEFEELFNNHQYFSKKIYYNYFEYILINNMMSHIKLFLKEYCPIFMDNNYICCYFNKIYNGLAKETLMKQTLSFVIKTFSLNTLSYCIHNGLKNYIIYNNFENSMEKDITKLNFFLLKKLLKLFVKKLVKYITSSLKYFANKHNIELKDLKNKTEILHYIHIINLEEILNLCIEYNNPEFFKYSLKKLSSFLDNIDVGNIKNEKLYNPICKYKYFEYNEKMRKVLIKNILIRSNPCFEIYELILSDFKVEYLKNEFIYIVLEEISYRDDIDSYLEPILYHIYSKMGMDQEFIDNLFRRSYDFSKNMAKILVEYGADYEKYGKKVIREAKKINNKEVVNYITNLLENSD